MKRLMDIFLAVCTIAILSLPMMAIAIAVKATSPGPILYWSDRVGRHNRLFSMPKFRTMRIGTPALPTHLMVSPKEFLTPIGATLRRFSLDEFPQLWSILIGRMSFVGPRPALFNQADLIALRTECGVDDLVPGLTGWAQIKGRDDLPIPVKVALDAEYLSRRSILLDLKILFWTVAKVIKTDGVAH